MQYYTHLWTTIFLQKISYQSTTNSQYKIYKTGVQIMRMFDVNNFPSGRVGFSVSAKNNLKNLILNGALGGFRLRQSTFFQFIYSNYVKQSEISSPKFRVFSHPSLGSPANLTKNVFLPLVSKIEFLNTLVFRFSHDLTWIFLSN